MKIGTVRMEANLSRGAPERRVPDSASRREGGREAVSRSIARSGSGHRDVGRAIDVGSE